MWSFCGARSSACCRIGNTPVSAIPAATGIRSTFKCISFWSTADTSGLAKQEREQKRQVVRCDATRKRLDTINPLPRTNFGSPNGANGPVTPWQSHNGMQRLPPTERRQME